jgi:hypothetical protein
MISVLSSTMSLKAMKQMVSCERKTPGQVDIACCYGVGRVNDKVSPNC